MTISSDSRQTLLFTSYLVITAVAMLVTGWVSSRIGAKLVVPMHYRTDAIDFLDPPDAFLDELGAPAERHGSSELDVELPGELTVVLLAPPVQP